MYILPAELGTAWTDPDFDPKQSAFCYARVLEIPTPHWIVYDAFRYGIEIPEGADTTLQERDYTPRSGIRPEPSTGATRSRTRARRTKKSPRALRSLATLKC